MIWRGVLENTYMGIFQNSIWGDMIWVGYYGGILQYNISRI